MQEQSAVMFKLFLVAVVTASFFQVFPTLAAQQKQSRSSPRLGEGVQRSLRSGSGLIETAGGRKHRAGLLLKAKDGDGPERLCEEAERVARD
jgi:hypothetical protein